MRITLIALFLAVGASAMAQKYYYPGGYFENAGNDTWYEYVNDQDEPKDQFAQINTIGDYAIINNGEYSIAVPTGETGNFLIEEEGESLKFWKRCSKEPIHIVKKKPKRQRLTADEREKMTKNFNPRTPYDGVHMYSAPFGYINTRYVSKQEAVNLLNYAGCYTVASDNDSLLDVVRKDKVGYMDFLSAEDTRITGVFDGNKISRCTYVFTYDNKGKADMAMRHLKDHMKLASSGRDGEKYKVAWLEDTSYFTIREQEADGMSQLIVDVEYK